jgi:hypothetical protein
MTDQTTQQNAMSAMMLRIKTDYQRYDAIKLLGKKTEKDGLNEASLYLTKASAKEIESALLELEEIKGKKYQGKLPYAGIIDSFIQGGITNAELPVWLDQCKKSTFCSGHRFQPLPSHDEAWTTFSKVHSIIYPKRLAAETIKFRITVVTFLDAELVQAAEWGFWDDMSDALKRRLYLLLPIAKRSIIKQLPPDEAMQATRNHYDKSGDPA